jgi:hypothetical protein
LFDIESSTPISTKNSLRPIPFITLKKEGF